MTLKLKLKPETGDDALAQQSLGGVIYIDCHICITLGKENRAQPGSYLCESCTNKLRNLLQDIADMDALASDPEFLAGTEDHTSAKWLGSKAPCDPYVVSLTDRRSKYTRKGDPISAARVLGAWVQAISDNMGQVYSGTEDAQGYAGFLVTFLAWVCQQPAVERFARHVAATKGALARGVAA